MAQLSGKLERVLELKATPEQFLHVWGKTAHHIPNHTPTNIQSVDVHEGDWETNGSIKIWNYTVGGKNEVLKEKVEVDEANKTITLNGVEGHVMEIYNVFQPVYKLDPKGQGSLCTCTIYYGKKNESIPAPDIYMDFMVSLTKDIDEGLSKA